ncbi:MAG: glycoside hydrolase family 3 C-terminal domain-containing protein [Butyrivibrio sp.]|jgi:beta-glucosidase|nr:glycoside hydrolase family 3 C-terminal domain-containing protein [Butyrivibrio sp.]
MARDLKKLISEMTLEEKAGLCSGADFWHTKAVERLGIPAVMVSDGPHGLRKQDQEGDHLGINDSIVAVCFPAACATASSFDTEMIHHMGDVIGQECQAEDLSVVLGPAVNIKRSPLCGRNFEYFSEDPFLAGKMAAAYISGVQKWDVGTSIKHFAANNQEHRRMSVNDEVSERTLREIYFPAFEEAVKKAQPKTVMCSYNKINGTYSSDNQWLLTQVLRRDWGFKGYVMTDWGAVDDRVQGIRAGLDLEMPASNGENDRKIVEAVQSGMLDEKLVDQAAERILEVIFSYVDHRHPEAVFDRDADHEKAVEIETQCAVLLQNNGVLPLKASDRIAYIGEFADKPRYQGGGSSHINSSKVTSALSSAQRKGRKVTYVKGFSADADVEDEEEIRKAVAAAVEADVAVIFAGLPDSFESEGYDRDNMKLPECQNRMIEAVLKVQPNTVVILHNGSPVECPWAERTAGILEMYLGGQGVGEATDQLLYGEVNPSGHLAESFPLHLEDNPSYLFFPGDGHTARYAEGVFVGYRYYDTKKLPVRWAFGHGLSYTTFAYDHMKVSADHMTGDSILTVSVDVKNTGSVKGKEVVQLYVRDLNKTAERPLKELKGFAKTELEPGETKTVQMQICARDLSYFEERLGDWYAPSGDYELLIGSASDDIRCSGRISFKTEKLLPLKVAGDTTIGELMSDPRTAQTVQKMMQEAGKDSPLTQSSSDAGQEAVSDKMMQEMMAGMPLKSLVSFGMMNLEQMEGLIAMLNQSL